MTKTLGSTSAIGTAALGAALALALTTGAAAPAAVGGHHPDRDDWRTLQAGAEPQSNPLKGFIPFAGDYPDFPHSMEWSYFPLNAVMTGP